MATIKSYTDLEQSKKLAEILPLESADMWYHGHYSPWESERKYDNEPCPFHSMSSNWDKPCWSLTALLSILKYPSLIQDVENKWSITDWTGAYPKSEYGFDSPIDACYEMIIKLHELNLL